MISKLWQKWTLINKKLIFVLIYNFLIKGSSAVVFDVCLFAISTLLGKKKEKNPKKIKIKKKSIWARMECFMTFRNGERNREINNSSTRRCNWQTSTC